ncbi:MAG: NifU family protein [Planctomycetes bacterium]|nr:NifU family protein [Planctomycetota bacterium]MCK5472397.1 NifU family protein [Planctomycetota bacterium]
MSDKCDCGGCCGDNLKQAFEAKVQKVIEIIRPMLQNHGGDIELVDSNGSSKIRVRLQGACRGCPGAKMTLRMGVERLLKEHMPEIEQVEAVD